jgi:hypothetical protein
MDGKNELKRRMEDLLPSEYSEGVLWRMAEKRVTAKHRELVKAEYEALRRAAKESIREELELESYL